MLRESEERYRTLAEAVPDLIFIIGPDDCIQYVNLFAAAFIGLPPEEIIGQPRALFFSPPANGVRAMAHSLHPPVLDVGGINLSLQDYCQEFVERMQLQVDYQGQNIPGLPDEIGISLYRFVREALTNILKHAQATRSKVWLDYRNDRISLSVSDNGRGISDPSHSDGIGVLGIQERLDLLGGNLQIRSRKGCGAKLTACVPWPRTGKG